MRFPTPHLIVTFAAAAGLALAPPAAVLAAEPTPSEISVARRLFDEGKSAEENGRWREAADKFRQAAAIKDTPGIRFHLARCEEERGALVEALVEYDRARELLDGGVKAPDVERLLPEARERVRARVAHVTLRLPDGVQTPASPSTGSPSPCRCSACRCRSIRASIGSRQALRVVPLTTKNYSSARARYVTWRSSYRR